KRLSGKPRVRRRLVPAHSGDGMLLHSLRETSQLPRGRTGPPRGVAEPVYRFRPCQRPALVEEPLRPEVGLLVASRVHELFVFLVGHLVLVDPEILERELGKVIEAGDRERDLSPGDQDRARRSVSRGREPPCDLPVEPVVPRRGDLVSGLETRFLDPPGV